ISRLTAARPKIADYPFTTLTPTLGVGAADEGNTFVMADIPGLIEGASQGAGLGHRFLRHVQRCRLLVHLLDAGRIDPEAPLADFEKINAELAAFDPGLAEKKQVVVVSKMDLFEDDQPLALVRRTLPGGEVFGVSAVTGHGLDELKWSLFRLLKEEEDKQPGWEES
ncbi:MAG: 50S ribosome-binding GTPase, partial [Deltaproteobacteria bacterium]|nr:50S ribosome-binding GTPase [Deltaproteobacteria bacterium]